MYKLIRIDTYIPTEALTYTRIPTLFDIETEFFDMYNLFYNEIIIQLKL